MPELDVDSFSDGGAEAAAVEQSKVDAAIDAVIADVQGSDLGIEPESEGELIAGKYKSVDDVANALKSQQSENQRLRDLLKERGVVEPEVSPEFAEAEAADTSEPEPEPVKQLDPEAIKTMISAIHERVGGEDEYKRLQQWAKKNVTVEEAERYAEILESGNTEAASRAVGDLQFRRLQQQGYEPTMLRGRVSDGTKPGFQSDAEMTAAMSDPRYSSQHPDYDPAYVREVEGRVRKMLQGEAR